ncbi:MAG: PIG-L deacetylase family protein [Pseudonocardiaceae bacterium]
MPRSAIGGIRQEEQRKATAVLGVTDVEFLGYPDGQLTVTHELRRDLSRAIRRVRPDRVVTRSPQRDHPSLLADESLDAWTVPEVWIMSANDRAEHYVDVTDTVDRTIAALREHTSQTAHMTDLEDRMRGWVRWQATAAQFDEGRLAEGFLVLDTR